MESVFFRETQNALHNITEMFDNVHSLTASLMYVRRIINESVDDSSTKTNLDFQQLIDPDRQVHGVNYRKVFIETPWSVQEEKLAWILLNNLFAIHEGWVERLYQEVFDSSGYNKEKFISKLKQRNLLKNLSSYFVTQCKLSITLDGAFYNTYKASSGLDFNKLDVYMSCYRLFKEARNCYMHCDLVASQQLIDAYTDFLTQSAIINLDVSEVPTIRKPVLNQHIELSLRSVIGFSQIVRRILIITDISLLRTKAAESDFTKRFPPDWQRKVLGNNELRAKNRITRFSRKLGLLDAQWTPEYEQFLINKHIFMK